MYRSRSGLGTFLAVTMLTAAQPGCMHSVVKGTRNVDKPMGTRSSTSVKKGTRVWAEWTKTTPQDSIRIMTEDTCVKQDVDVVFRTEVTEHEVEGSVGHWVWTLTGVAGFGIPAVVMLSDPHTPDDPRTPENEKEDLTGDAQGLGLAAVGILALGAIWAATVNANAKEDKGWNVGEVEQPLKPVRSACNQRPLAGVVVEVYDEYSKQVINVATEDEGLARTDADGMVSLDWNVFREAYIQAPSRSGWVGQDDGRDRDTHVLVSVDGQKSPVSTWGHSDALDAFVSTNYPKRLKSLAQQETAKKKAAQDAARRDAAEAAAEDAADAQRAAAENRAAIARGECPRDFSNGVECELRLCAKIASRVRSMAPDSSCFGTPMAKLRSDWMGAMRTIDNYLSLLQGGGQMRDYLRIQRQANNLCKTPQWFRSCSN